MTGKVTDVYPNLTEEEYDLMTMNRAKREKKMAKDKAYIFEMFIL